MHFAVALLLEALVCCRYLVTFSNVVDNPDDPQNVVVWDISTGEKKRTFSKLPSEDWPTLKWVKGMGRGVTLGVICLTVVGRWSFDGKYFARRTKGLLSVYETPVSVLVVFNSF